MLVRNYADKMLTSHFLLSEILEAAGNYQTFIARPQTLRALSDYWERAIYSAFFECEEAQTVAHTAEQARRRLGPTSSRSSARCFSRA